MKKLISLCASSLAIGLVCFISDSGHSQQQILEPLSHGKTFSQASLQNDLGGKKQDDDFPERLKQHVDSLEESLPSLSKSFEKQLAIIKQAQESMFRFDHLYKRVLPLADEKAAEKSTRSSFEREKKQIEKQYEFDVAARKKMLEHLETKINEILVSEKEYFEAATAKLNELLFEALDSQLRLRLASFETMETIPDTVQKQMEQMRKEKSARLPKLVANIVATECLALACENKKNPKLVENLVEFASQVSVVRSFKNAPASPVQFNKKNQEQLQKSIELNQRIHQDLQRCRAIAFEQGSIIKELSRNLKEIESSNTDEKRKQIIEKIQKRRMVDQSIELQKRLVIQMEIIRSKLLYMTAPLIGQKPKTEVEFMVELLQWLGEKEQASRLQNLFKKSE